MEEKLTKKFYKNMLVGPAVVFLVLFLVFHIYAGVSDFEHSVNLWFGLRVLAILIFLIFTFTNSNYTIWSLHFLGAVFCVNLISSFSWKFWGKDFSFGFSFGDTGQLSVFVILIVVILSWFFLYKAFRFLEKE